MGKRKNVVEREQSKKGDGTLSKGQLLSSYAASALIVVICVVEALKPETAANGNPALYYFLAVLGVAFSVFITLRNKSAQKSKPSGPRLKS